MAIERVYGDLTEWQLDALYNRIDELEDYVRRHLQDQVKAKRDAAIVKKLLEMTRDAMESDGKPFEVDVDWVLSQVMGGKPEDMYVSDLKALGM